MGVLLSFVEAFVRSDSREKVFLSFYTTTLINVLSEVDKSVSLIIDKAINLIPSVSQTFQININIHQSSLYLSQRFANLTQSM